MQKLLIFLGILISSVVAWATQCPDTNTITLQNGYLVAPGGWKSERSIGQAAKLGFLGATAVPARRGLYQLWACRYSINLSTTNTIGLKSQQPYIVNPSNGQWHRTSNGYACANANPVACPF